MGLLLQGLRSGQPADSVWLGASLGRAAWPLIIVWFTERILRDLQTYFDLIVQLDSYK